MMAIVFMTTIAKRGLFLQRGYFQGLLLYRTKTRRIYTMFAAMKF